MERPPFLGLPYPMLDYLLSLPGDHAKALLRVTQLARASAGVVDGIPLAAGEALISLRSEKVWGRVALDAEGLKADGIVALRRRALARAERDGWIALRTAHRTSTGNDTENGTRSSTPATVVRFLKFREILWPATDETAHQTAHQTAQEPAHQNGTIPPEDPPEPPCPPETLKLAPSADASPPPALASLPCVGKGPTAYDVTEAHVASWREAFPGVDVLGEIRKARVWLDANPTKRKTHRGMPAFLVRWLSKVQDRGGSATASSSKRGMAPIGKDWSSGAPWDAPAVRRGDLGVVHGGEWWLRLSPAERDEFLAERQGIDPGLDRDAPFPVTGVTNPGRVEQLIARWRARADGRGALLAGGSR